MCEGQGWDYKLKESQERDRITTKLGWSRSQMSLDALLHKRFDFIFLEVI